MHYISKILTFGSLGLLLLLFAGLVSIIQSSKKSILTIGLATFRVEIADEPAEWQRGLAGRTPLDLQEGLLFIFPTVTQRTFWMKDMTFPIDIIWIKDDRVVGFVDQAQPDQGQTVYASPGPVDKVLEVAAGERKRLEIAIGAPVSVE